VPFTYVFIPILVARLRLAASMAQIRLSTTLFMLITATPP